MRRIVLSGVLATSGHMSPALAKFAGWAVVITVVVIAVTVFLRMLGFGR